MNSDQPIPPVLDDKPRPTQNLGKIGLALSLIAPVTVLAMVLLHPG